MSEKQQDFSSLLSKIATSQDVAALRDATVAVVSYLGIAKGYFVTPPKADPRAGRIVVTLDLPATWTRHYRGCLYSFDPVPALAMARAGPFVWPEDIDPDVWSERDRRFLKLAGRYGLGRGIGTVCYGPHGRCGFLGLILAPDAPRPDEQVLLRINSMGQIAFQHYCSLVRSDDSVVALSRRELEVLQLMSIGKSNGVIAEVLSIAPSSVDVYVRRIFAKLGVSDRTTASTKALALGLIVSWDHQRLMREAAARRL